MTPSIEPDDLEYNPMKKSVKSRAAVRWKFSAKAGISRRAQTYRGQVPM
jgi:hypothetical protein